MQAVQDAMLQKRQLEILDKGLESTTRPLSVIILGAGMAGLVAGSLLKAAGHEVTILEANNRVGGRVFTMRSPFSEGLYLDMGAMRISQNHKLTLQLIKKFKLKVRPFYNATTDDLIYTNGILTNYKKYKRTPSLLRFPLNTEEEDKTATELLNTLLKPLIQLQNQDPKAFQDKLSFYDHYSVNDFLKYNPFNLELSQGAIDMIEVLLGIKAFSTLSFAEILKQYMLELCLEGEHFYEIAGGNDQLPTAFLSELQGDILLEKVCKKIDLQGNKVVIEALSSESGRSIHLTSDIVITTLPYPLFRFMKITPYDALSYEKWKSIRTIHSGAAVKVGIEFKHKFWEAEGLAGCKAVTDLPIRFTYYPHPERDQQHAVILASYTLERDAFVWEGFSNEQRVIEALENLAILHGKHIYKAFVTGSSHSWMQDPYAGGAFAAFKPGQKAELASAIASPEGRLYFAGEQTSHFPCWIEGAVESGIRVAEEVNQIGLSPSSLIG
ncbi:monoamine oxidase [Pullulanibacillus pueri]|uniref:Amine oxidase n=1 Tax=Pullulanibacillus pueri TaxID=1437324 RepID=A0A8J2ZSU4_9BACL|nr:flavin monoamine oxidase family protein [Pullulanibacillus pueri]MBM7680342.1 monoamine oxidase [Pullulanibacillus pueri]GGH75554.1 amine oxidase [Pullulanibacillus pueri]